MSFLALWLIFDLPLVRSTTIYRAYCDRSVLRSSWPADRSRFVDSAQRRVAGNSKQRRGSGDRFEW